MKRSICAIIVSAAFMVCSLWGGRGARAADAPAPASRSAPRVEDLSRQVWALEIIHDLELNERQLQALKAAAPDPEPQGTAGADDPAGPKIPQKYVTALRTLRDALLKGDDPDHITELRDDVEAMVDDENIDVNDNVSISDAARAKVPQIIRMLAPTQVAAYVVVYQDEVPDPIEALVSAVKEARDTADDDAAAVIDEKAQDLAMMLAGIDPLKYNPLALRVKEWLTRWRKMPEAEFKGKSQELEASAAELAGDLDPFAILRHWLERDLAELLSNPELKSIIDVRLNTPQMPKEQ